MPVVNAVGTNGPGAVADCRVGSSPRTREVPLGSFEAAGSSVAAPSEGVSLGAPPPDPPLLAGGLCPPSMIGSVPTPSPELPVAAGALGVDGVSAGVAAGVALV